VRKIYANPKKYKIENVIIITLFDAQTFNGKDIFGKKTYKNNHKFRMENLTLVDEVLIELKSPTSTFSSN